MEDSYRCGKARGKKVEAEMGKNKQQRSEYQQSVIYAWAEMYRNVINKEKDTNQ